MTRRRVTLAILAALLFALLAGAALPGATRLAGAEELEAHELEPMPRKPTGNVYQSHGAWFARVTLGAKLRPSIPLPTCQDEAAALDRLAIVNDLAGKLRAAKVEPDTARRILERAGSAEGKALAEVRRVGAGLAAGDLRTKAALLVGVTVEALARRWMSGELHREHPDRIALRKTVDTDRSRFECHVFPVAGTVPIQSFTIDHGEAILRALPSGLEASTRAHVARLVSRLLSLAVYPLRIIAANPLPRGFIPDDGPRKALAYLYPTEDAALLACVAIPLATRMLYGFIAREGLRAGEACALTVADVDLVRGAVRLDENKTDDPRAWALSPGVPEALRAWLALRVKNGATLDGNSPIFTDRDGAPIVRRNELARALRANMRRAGIDRAELYKASASRIAMRLHDLRGTFVTIALANGKTERWVKDRTGHKSSRMVETYTRIARTAEELGLGPLLPLVAALPEFAANGEDLSSKGGGKGGEGGSGARKASKRGTSARRRMAMSAMRAYQSQRSSCEEGAAVAGERAASAQRRATWRSMAARRA